ncbi:phosphotransferase [Streptomyces albidoflavus]
MTDRQGLRGGANVVHRSGGVDAAWWLPAREPAGVICHGDAAPCNSVVREGEAVGLIDFDAALLGPRVSGVAHAVHRFAPLQGPDNPESFGKPQEQPAAPPPSAGRTARASAPRSSTPSRNGCGSCSPSCATGPPTAPRRSGDTWRKATPRRTRPTSALYRPTAPPCGVPARGDCRHGWSRPCRRASARRGASRLAGPGRLG